MIKCKKFIKCSAPQCPLIESSLKSKYISGEPICLWLLEFSKNTSRNDLESAIGDIPIETIEEAYNYLFGSNGTLKSRLVRASETPSRLQTLGKKCKESEEQIDE